jgi:hypothetical protein
VSLPFDPARAPFDTAPPSATGRAPGGGSPSGRKPSSAGYWIAGVAGVVGVIAAVAWFAISLVGYFGAVDSYTRFSVPGSRTVQLDAGTYKVFAEYPGANLDVSGTDSVGVVRVVDATGRPVVISNAVLSESYAWNGHDGRSIAQFTAPTTGQYTVSAAEPAIGSSSGVQVAVGRGLGDSVVGPVLGSMAVGAISVLFAIVLVIVTAVRRGRWRRRNLPPPNVGYPGCYGPSGFYPPAGPYGAPPGAYGPPAGAYGPPPGANWGTHPGPPPQGPPVGSAPVGPPGAPAPGWGAPPGSQAAGPPPPPWGQTPTWGPGSAAPGSGPGPVPPAHWAPPVTPPIDPLVAPSLTAPAAPPSARPPTAPVGGDRGPSPDAPFGVPPTPPASAPSVPRAGPPAGPGVGPEVGPSPINPPGWDDAPGAVPPADSSPPPEPEDGSEAP